METKIQLSTIKDVSGFVNAMQGVTANAELVSGRYVIDARSIMGIYSLNLSNPVILRIDASATEEEKQACVKAVKQYIVA